MDRAQINYDLKLDGLGCKRAVLKWQKLDVIETESCASKLNLHLDKMDLYIVWIPANWSLICTVRTEVQ